MLRIVSITAVILTAAVATARADVYRWVDEHGVPHYSDQWVPGSEIIKTGKIHPPGTENNSADQRGLSASNKRMDAQLSEQANARAVQQDVAKSKESQCKAMTARYQKAVESRRIYKTDADGSKQYLDDPTADAYREQARKDVQEACGSVPEINMEAPIPPPVPLPPASETPGQ
jgi:Domain of unknown function (DUF4124)